MSQQPSHLEMPNATPTPPPTPPAAPTQQPVVDGPPVATGTVFLTPETRRSLEAWGWKEGDPVPDAWSEQYAQAYKQIEEDIANARPNVPEDFKLVAEEPIPIDMLPPDQQASIRASLDRAKTIQTDMQKQADQDEAWQVPGASPEVNQAIRQNKAALAHQQKPAPMFQLLDDVDEKMAADQSGPKIPPIVEPPVEPATATDIPEMPETPPVMCPKCGHNTALPYEAEPTADDKMLFTAGILSQGKARFVKAYTLYNSAVVVVFQTLASAEMQDITRQVNRDIADGGVRTEMDMLAKVMEYRSALSLYSVAGKDLSWIIPATIQTEPPTEEPLKKLLEIIDATVLAAEPFKRVVLRKFNEFQRLVEKLEVMVDDPDF